MKKTFRYALLVLQMSWKANGIYAVLSPLSVIYAHTLFPLIEILLLAKILDTFSKYHMMDVNSFMWIIGTYLCASLLKIILDTLVSTREIVFSAQLDNYLDRQIDKKLAQLDPATFENTEFQNKMAQLDGIKGAISSFMIGVISIIDSVVKLISAAIIVFGKFPLFIPLLIIATVPYYISNNKFREKVWPFFGSERSLVVRISHYIRTLLSSDATSKESTIFKTAPILLAKEKQQQSLFMNKFSTVVNNAIESLFFASIFQYAIFLYAQYLNFIALLTGKLSIGAFALYFQQTLNLASGAHGMLENYSSISMRTKYVENYLDLLHTKRIITSPKSPKLIPKIPNPPIINLRNVSFRYPGTERYIYQNLSLTIESGEKIAIVGEKGAGKTTLIKLLLRFYDVIDGEILINGVNIKELNLEEWHTYIGALFQDFIKYQFTFKENVFFGDLTKLQKKEHLQEAIKQSGAYKYLDFLPKGIDQVVGKMFDEGIDLSGGQWQKLALARAFFRNAPILILDEPTSAIDAKAEYEIFENVQKLQKDKTVIIISHRFSTVRNADRILVIDEGKIVEEGNHVNLIKKNGLYAELFNIQAQGYK